MTVIIDYGVGNLFSLRSSFAAIGEEATVTADPAALSRADRIVLPGVGAFADAMAKLRASGMEEALRAAAAKGTPILGICLGMQLLFDKSYEYGEHAGLAMISGEVREIPVSADLKLPHMGWNALSFGGRKHSLFRYLEEGDYVYFVHSYAAVGCDPFVIARAEYGGPVTAAVAKGNVMGCQFHPEKSGNVGLRILKAFCEIKEGEV